MNENKVILYCFCDMHKSFDSMHIPEAVFSDTLTGRQKLLARIKADIDKEDVSLFDGQTMEALEDAVLNGTVQSMNDYIDYAYFCQMDVDSD